MRGFIGETKAALNTAVLVGIAIFFFFQVLQSYRNELCFLIWLIVTVTFLFSELLSQEFRSELSSQNSREQGGQCMFRGKKFTVLCILTFYPDFGYSGFLFFFLFSLTRSLSVLLIPSKTQTFGSGLYVFLFCQFLLFITSLL